MDVDSKEEDNQQDQNSQDESCELEPASDNLSQKRKRTDDGDSEDSQTNKKVKMEEETVAEAEDSPKKEDPADNREEDRDLKGEDKESSSAGEQEGSTGEEERCKGNSKPAEQSKQEEQLEESTVETGVPLDMVENKKKLSEEEKEISEEKEGETRQKEIEKSEVQQGSEPETEEKQEVVQRRYPTRSRRGEEKVASQSVKANGSLSEDKRPGNSYVDREELSHDTEGDKAASIKSDSGSDKENMTSDAAVDLSNAGTPDVIMLSEEEETEKCKEKKSKRKKQVRRLQALLRNEEAKLVLLKKLRQSQLTPQVQDHTSVSNSSGTNQLPKQAVPRQQGGPPPLVRGNQQVRSSNLHMQQQNRTPSQGQMRNIQGPPPLVVTPRMGANSTNGHGNQSLRNTTTSHTGQHGSSTLRPVQQQQQTMQHQQQSLQHQQAATPPQPQVDTQTPAQRQAAAKLALRKQLEKTLLQIPPPKPPAPEMNFIPSLACPDFILLLGLEEVVNHIIDLQLIARGQKSPDEKFICNPFTCVQCGTDYTPVWKREKPGSKNVICEHCVTWNQKRALKQEHTNRLKSAFVKALQQEQEIERMQGQTSSNPSTPTPSVTPPTSASSSAPSQALAAAAAANNVAAAAAMSMSPASFRPSAEQVRHHHSFLQAQAQLRAGQSLPGLQGFGARSPFPYNLPYVKQADLQRQYLLDMIPRATGMPWKQ